MKTDNRSDTGPERPVSPSPILSMRAIVKRFGAFAALSGVDFDLEAGEVHVLFGENGAGKSTLIQIMAGVLQADEGEYQLLSKTVEGVTPARMQHAGISAVFQEFSLIPEMTVTENIFLGRELMRFGRLDKAAMRKATVAILAKLGFPLDPDTRIVTLRRAHMQMVEIAKALLHDAKVIIFDEPTASLADQEAAALFDLIGSLRDRGLGIVYITHRMAEIDRLADRVTVLRDGNNICTLAREDITHSTLVKSMTGRSFESFYPKIARNVSSTAVAVKNLTAANGLVDQVDFEIRRGEVLGIAGLAGCGKSELIRAIYGLEKITDGTITLGAQPVVSPMPNAMLGRKLCYFPSDRATEGLSMRQSLGWNATIAALDDSAFSKRNLWIRHRSERDFAQRIINRLNIKARSVQAPIESMSGGNKQKVLLSRGLSRELDIYLFDEPTVGVDVQAKVEIYNFIKELTEAGKAVVVCSSDMAEVIHISHRLLVMRSGRIVAEMEGDDISEEALLTSFFDHPVNRPHAIEGERPGKGVIW
ncbi:ribose transport system ATP-binding protein [Rhizobium leguminosarum]|uniref:Ribose transport system ATP-binding protein n=1 Tax=Rhizobium leguminosarum TaxID=384 RepID=A0AAE2SYQ6_RHILE|nr:MULTISPECIES: sugar ABC transporter ATP-binding protein [Rhizobium]MBB4291794.1 ribose transport system ATP-binding protein [Rhizobium leguminosarum]MBB4298395.1 ribose transport system ATP-binding protein [Rhizobium leguminosarum]MBB4309533.1 ribose transport system ATP-binding protein [Rhizobium leguminosarum]MBB4418970.1 ribose transport system ATP-binding protein [Rhizobium leguminosarum]MBB4433699.1 ribose transport system ATP-binding protein [Rhizobium esperanzae]